jgi:hypothetical protein
LLTICGILISSCDPSPFVSSFISDDSFENSDSSGSNIYYVTSENTDVSAEFSSSYVEIEYHTVTFMNWDDDILQIVSVEDGGIAICRAGEVGETICFCSREELSLLKDVQKHIAMEIPVLKSPIIFSKSETTENKPNPPKLINVVIT